MACFDPVLTALSRLATAWPRQVALVFPAAGTWRWRSWGWLASEVGRVAEELARAPHVRWSFDDRPTPEAIVLDLAARAAGHVASPGAPNDDTATVGFEPQTTAADLILGRLWLRGSELAARPLDAHPLDQRGEGGADVQGAAGSRRWAIDEIRRAIESVGAVVGPSGDREIVVSTGPLRVAVDRAWTSWALAHGLPLVLVPDAAEVALDIWWTRPTRLCLTAKDEAATRERIGSEPQRRRRRWYRRLRTVVVHDGVLDVEALSFWEELDVEVVNGTRLVLP